MIVSTDAITGRRMLSSEIFMRRRFYSTVSSFTGSPSRSWSVPETISVSPGANPCDDLYPRFRPQPGFYGYGVGFAAL